MNFKKKNERKRMQQNFDRDNIVMERAGKKINVYDFIQAGREDTEIYEVLEKYGCIDKIKLDTEAVYLDVTELQAMNGLRGVVEQQNRAKNIFEQLPIEVRKEFNNSVDNFSKNGLKWITEKYMTEKAKEEHKEMTTNEQK